MAFLSIWTPLPKVTTKKKKLINSSTLARKLPI